MESLIVKLCTAHPAAVRHNKKTVQRWVLIARHYKAIRETILSNAKVMDQTRLTLLEINMRTLTTWFNSRTKHQERQMLEQGLRLPLSHMTSSGPLPPAIPRLTAADIAPVPEHLQHPFKLPPITIGTAMARSRHGVPSETPPNPESVFPRTVIVLPPPLPKTTLWYHKRQHTKQRAGEVIRRNKTRRETHTYTCGKCGLVRTSETHSQYYGSWYCAVTAPQSYEEWRSSREKCRLGKKQQKLKDDTPQPDPQ